MSTVFTAIIEGQLPARFLWKDDHCVVFLSIAPLAPGHALVVPRVEIDHWVDLDADLAAHLMKISQVIAQAQREVFDPLRVGQMIQGFEVPHCHIHVWPTNSIEEFNFAQVDQNPDPHMMDDAAARIREALRQAGHHAYVPQA